MAKVLEKSNVVALSKMKDGDVAEVVKWRNNSVPQGTVVQRYGKAIVLIGVQEDRCYHTIFDEVKSVSSGEYLVTILPKGTKIIL